jgi:hypothetical protein
MLSSAERRRLAVIERQLTIDGAALARRVANL